MQSDEGGPEGRALKGREMVHRRGHQAGAGPARLPGSGGAAVLIVGAGALGTYLAARFALAGNAVSVMARGRRLDELTRNGLHVEGVAGRDLEISILSAVSPIPAVDFAFICTKTCDFESCCDSLIRADLQGTAIITVQNGVYAPQVAASRFPGSAVIAARVHGFFQMAENSVRHIGVEPSLEFGQAFGPENGWASRFAALVSGSGIRCTASPDVMATLWEKFLLASSLGGVGAATGYNVGQIRVDADAWQLLACALREAEALARMHGQTLPDDVAERILRFVESFPSDATTSLMRDLEMGRPSEYADLTGAVLTMARRVALNVPAFERIEAGIRARGLIR